jgi:hypothetical protein
MRHSMGNNMRIVDPHVHMAIEYAQTLSVVWDEMSFFTEDLECILAKTALRIWSFDGGE